MQAPRSKPRSPTALLGGFYFLNYGGLGALFPFLPLLLQGRRLSATQISWVMVISPLFNLLMPPLWGAVADALQARLALLRLAAFGCGLSILALLPAWGFRGSLLALTLISVFRSPTPALADAATYAALSRGEPSEGKVVRAERGKAAGARRGRAGVDFYGHVRVWGSIGFGVGALAVGRLGGSLHPSLVIAIAASIYSCSGLLALRLPAANLRRERGVLREAAGLLLQPAMLIFLCGNVAYYFAHAILDAYLSLHLRALAFDDRVISQAWAIGVAAEVLVMLAAPALIAGRRSSPLLAACSVIAAARWHLLARLRSQRPILALQALHGLSFGLWYLAMVQHVQARAPERLRTTLQASAQAAVGLGSIAGILIGGGAFEAGGGTATFNLAEMVALGSFLCYALVAAVEPRWRAA